jgi:hypothetical protein
MSCAISGGSSSILTCHILRYALEHSGLQVSGECFLRDTGCPPTIGCIGIASRLIVAFGVRGSEAADTDVNQMLTFSRYVRQRNR